ncbi:MAG: hypothetical protein ACREPX_15075 [Rhodanobacteraceae bacterium]
MLRFSYSTLVTARIAEPISEEASMDKSAAQAFAYWILGGIAIAAIAQLIPGLIPPRPDSNAEAIVRAFAHTGIAALAAWMIARRRPGSWSWRKFGSVYVFVFLAFALIISIGQASNAMR